MKEVIDMIRENIREKNFRWFSWLVVKRPHTDNGCIASVDELRIIASQVLEE